MTTASASIDTQLQPEDQTQEKSDSEIERELIDLVDQMTSESDGLVVQRMPKWNDGINYWRGRQWVGRKQRKSKGKAYSESMMNRVFPMIEQKVAMLTDNNPTGVFIPQNADDEDFAADIESLTKWRVRRMKGRQKLIKAAHNMAMFGEQAIKVVWDDSSPSNADCDWVLLGPWELIMDKFATNVDDAEFVGSKKMVALNELQDRWPEHAEKLEEQATTTPQNAQPHTNAATAAGPLDDEVGRAVDGRSERGSESIHSTQSMPMVEVVEIYFNDYSELDVEVGIPFDTLEKDGHVQMDETIGGPIYTQKGVEAGYGVPIDGQPAKYFASRGPTEVTQEKAYPDGRMVIKVNNIILEDRPWKGKWPIAIGINTPIPFRWFGMSDVEPLQEDQDTINDFLSMQNDHVRLASNPRLKGVATSIKNRKAIRGAPDEMILMENGRMKDIEYLLPGPLGNDLYTGMSMIERNMETTSGISGQQLSKQASKQQTATEVSALERAGRGRVGLLSALFDEFISRLFLLTAECIQNNYSPGKKIRILGENSQSSVIEMQQGHREVKFDVEVEAGSTLPFDKQARKLDAQYIYSILGDAYLPELLEIYSDVAKNKEELLERYPVWQAFQQIAPLMQDPNFMAMVEQFAAQNQELANGQGN